MTILDYLHILRRRWWILLLALLLTTASAGVFSKLQTPTYKASALVLMKPARTDFGLTQTAQIMLRSQVAALQTRSNAQSIIAEMQLDLSPDELLGMTKIAADTSRFVIQIDVICQNSTQASEIAYRWALVLQQLRNVDNARARSEDQVYAEPLDSESFYPVPSLYRPQTKINLLAGAVLGLLLGGVVIFILEYLEAGIIRSAQDIDRALALPVLGLLPPETGTPAAARRSQKGETHG